MYLIIVTWHQMMSFDFVIQLSHRPIGPLGVLCHPDQHHTMVSSPLQSKLFDKRAIKNTQKERSIYHVVTVIKILQKG